MNKTKKNQKRSITERLKTDYPNNAIKPKEIIKHPITKIALGILIAYGLLISSTYFINGYANFVKAIKNLKNVRNR